MFIQDSCVTCEVNRFFMDNSVMCTLLLTVSFLLFNHLISSLCVRLPLYTQVRGNKIR